MYVLLSSLTENELSELKYIQVIGQGYSELIRDSERSRSSLDGMFVHLWYLQVPFLRWNVSMKEIGFLKLVGYICRLNIHRCCDIGGKWEEIKMSVGKPAIQLVINTSQYCDNLFRLYPMSISTLGAFGLKTV